MSTISAAVTRVDRIDHLIAPVVLAFSTDPFVRWLLPDPSQFLSVFTEVTRLHAQRTAANAGAYALGEGLGAAFWYAPGVHPDGEALGAIFERGGMADRIASVWEQVAEYEPSGPHWYLRQIGVDPALQGGGHGSALVRVALDDIDRRGELAYLEATSLRGRTFYERHGFSVLGEIQAAGSPPLWPMAREPRAA